MSALNPKENTMSDAPKPADALYIPESLISGSDALDLGEKLNEIARPLLGLKPGEWVGFKSPQPQDGVSYRFVIKHPDDTKMFPKLHPKTGQFRHDWIDGPDGIKLGYSKAD